MLGGNVSIMLLFVINAVFRGAGDAAIAMRVLILSNVLNIVLDPVFIFGFGPIPAFGVEGAAIATNIGRGSGVVCQLYYLMRGKGSVKVLRRHLSFHAGLVTKLIRVSAGAPGNSS